MVEQRNRRPRVVIIGAGFGGLAAARALRTVPVDVILVDQNNYHLFQPLLYQVASALLDPSEIAYPVRAAIRRCRNVDFRMARVEGIDLQSRRILTSTGVHEYDHLIVAAGSVTNFYGNHSVEERAFPLKKLGDALALRNHLLTMFERAAATDDPDERRRLLSVVLVGGGPTGVELAGAFSELVHLVLRKDFPRLDMSEVRVVLVEAVPSVLSAFSPRLQRAAVRTLRRKAIELRLGVTVREARDDAVVLADGDEIAAATIVWSAGVRGSDITTALGVERTRGGRIAVSPTTQLAGHPEVFVIGDLAHLEHKGAPLPQLAPVAMQQGRHAAACIAGSLRGESARPFAYRDKGTMATIGRNSAVAQVGPLSFTGFIGWVMWLGLHLILLVGFRSKLAAMLNWGFDYFFYNRPVRLIARPSERGHPVDETSVRGADAVESVSKE
jgi:NADH dehydrogenase